MKNKEVIEWQMSGVSFGYKNVPKDAIITSVNDHPVIGKCEHCRKLIFEGESYLACGEGVVIHRNCGE